VNKFVGLGRLTKDPEVRYSQGENPSTVSKITLAIDRKFKRDGEQSADFINCVAFGKTAEFQEKYFHKGTKVAIVGRLQTGSYTNKDGQKVYTTDVIVEEQEFAESKGSGGESENRTDTGIGDGFMNIPDGIDDEQLPFN
jgi:single-strand DNA-binding protein